jgi:hypothetical protein
VAAKLEAHRCQLSDEPCAHSKRCLLSALGAIRSSHRTTKKPAAKGDGLFTEGIRVQSCLIPGVLAGAAGAALVTENVLLLSP